MEPVRHIGGTAKRSNQRIRFNVLTVQTSSVQLFLAILWIYRYKGANFRNYSSWLEVLLTNTRTFIDCSWVIDGRVLSNSKGQKRIHHPIYQIHQFVRTKDSDRCCWFIAFKRLNLPNLVDQQLNANRSQQDLLRTNTTKQHQKLDIGRKQREFIPEACRSPINHEFDLFSILFRWRSWCGEDLYLYAENWKRFFDWKGL